MDDFFNVNTWERLSPAERIAQCREAAQTAQSRVPTARPEVKPLYEKLVAEWNALADEIANRQHWSANEEDK